MSINYILDILIICLVLLLFRLTFYPRMMSYIKKFTRELIQKNYRKQNSIFYHQPSYESIRKHIPVIEDILDKYSLGFVHDETTWKEIGRKINWDGITAALHYIEYWRNLQPQPNSSEMHHFLLVNTLRNLTQEQQAKLCIDLYEKNKNQQEIKQKINSI